MSRLNHCAAVSRRSTFESRVLPPQITKEEIPLKHVHPELTPTTVRCTSCGTTFTTRSTRSEIVVDVCSSCHPAYTGVERAARSGSRIERFERRRRLAAHA